jgi:hypothetical protein
MRGVLRPFSTRSSSPGDIGIKIPARRYGRASGLGSEVSGMTLCAVTRVSAVLGTPNMGLIA